MQPHLVFVRYQPKNYCTNNQFCLYLSCWWVEDGLVEMRGPNLRYLGWPCQQRGRRALFWGHPFRGSQMAITGAFSLTSELEKIPQLISQLISIPFFQHVTSPQKPLRTNPYLVFQPQQLNK